MPLAGACGQPVAQIREPQHAHAMPDPARLRATADQIRGAGAPVRASEVPGLSRARVRAAITGGVLLPLRAGIVVPTVDWENSDARTRHLTAMRAALLAYPDAWASHATALLLHGVAVDVPPLVHLSRTGTTFRDGTLLVHGQRVRPDQIIEVNGVRASSPIRASIEVAATRSLPDAVAVIDASMRTVVATRRQDLRHAVLESAVRERLFEEWDDAIAPYGRHRWVTTVRQGLRWADPAAESYLESVSRVAIRQSNLPNPAVGIPMMGDDGVTRWVDFWWEAHQLIGEADGLGKYTERDDLLREKLREESLTAPGRTLVRWGMRQVRPSPTPLIHRLQARMSPSGTIRWS